MFRRHAIYFSMLLLGVLTLGATPAMAVGIPDVMVNEENYLSDFEQQGLSTGHDADGNFVVCWSDMRESTSYGFFQLFHADGTPNGPNRKFETDPLYPGHEIRNPCPRLAMNSAGYFAIIYCLRTDGYGMPPQIVMRRYDPAGNEIGDRLQISSRGYSHSGIENTAIGINDNQQIVVLFETRGDGAADTYGQFLTMSGDFIGDNFPVLMMDSLFTQIPHVALNNQGQVFAAVLVSTLSSADLLLGNAFPFGMPPTQTAQCIDTGIYIQDGPRYVIDWSELAYQRNGNFCLAWHVRECEIHWEWEYRYYAQLFDGTGQNLSDRLPVFATIMDSLSRVTTAATPDGFFVSTKNRHDKTFVIQEISNTGETDYDYFRTVADTSVFPLGDVNLFKNSQGDLMYTMYDYTNEDMHNYDMYLQGYHADGQLSIEMQRINDDFGAVQSAPAVAIAPDGSSLTLWIDYRLSHSGDIFGQVLDADGNPVGSNFRVNTYDEPGNGYCRDLEMGYNKSGHAVAVWTGRGNSEDYAVHAAAFVPPSFTQNGEGVLIYEPSYSFYDFMPDAAVDSAGNFVVAWRHRPSENEYVYHAYMQYYLTDLTPLTGLRKINTSTGFEGTSIADNMVPRLAMKPSGDFGVTWIETFIPPGEVLPHPFVFFKTYDRYLFAQTDDIVISPIHSLLSYIYPDIAVNEFGEYAVAWSGGESCIWDGLVARVIKEDGTFMCDAFLYVNYDVFGNQLKPRIAAGPSREFIGVWYNSGAEQMDIFTQKFIYNGTLKGTVTRVNEDPGGYSQFLPDIAAFNNKVVFAWEDYRNGRGNADIFVNSRIWQELSGTTGDVNLDGNGDLLDLLFLIDFLYGDPPGPEPIIYDLGDINADGAINLLDLLMLISLFYS
ncbi:MAG: hypothetical protein JW763_10935 [candidate division Zixibacteria bacterium]|nr:hypothetical protein [candidate division Zixibacteria bacterium]